MSDKLSAREVGLLESQARAIGVLPMIDTLIALVADWHSLKAKTDHQEETIIDLNRVIQEWSDDEENMMAGVERLAAENAALVEALEFYADKKNWEPIPVSEGRIHPLKDGPQIARSALEKR